MCDWECGIAGCDQIFDIARDLVIHQVKSHDAQQCRVCGKTVPAGFFAIKHVVEQHSRQEYVVNYKADASEIYHREEIKEAVEAKVDIANLREDIVTYDD